MSVVKTSVENATKIKFAKVSFKFKCVMRIVLESINTLMNLSEAHKEEIRNELNMIQQMEENNL